MAPRWCFGLCRASFGGGVAEGEGVGYGLGQELAAGMVLSRAKAFTDAFVSGDGGGALVASFFLLGAPL